MVLEGNELAEAQARLLEKRRKLGIPERSSPKQEQSPSAENTGDVAPDPVANLNKSAKRSPDELPDSQHKLLRDNLTNDKPTSAEVIGPIASGLVRKAVARKQARVAASEEITRDTDAATRRPAPAQEQSAKTKRAGKSWGMLFTSLVATLEFRSLRTRNLHVLCAIITSRDNKKNGECAPGRKKIEALTGYAPRTIDRALLELINCGIMRQVRKAHVGQNAAFLVAEDGDEIARNLRESATPSIGALSTPESATPNIGA